MSKVQRALISVSDKTGIIDLARELSALGIAIISSGGTAQLLASHGIEVQEVSDYTGFPEMMAGRVKTLHPKIHGGILGRRGIDDATMLAHDIAAIDLVIVNLYPFEQTVANTDCTLDDAIENIDIGGPSLIRGAAKNHASVTVVVDPADYTGLLEELQRDHACKLSQASRFRLAAKAFGHTSWYDGAIAAYLQAHLANVTDADSLPDQLAPRLTLLQPLRYGENPHQKAGFYSEQPVPAGTLAAARQLQGKALSYNNIADADAALECVRSFEGGPACVIVKHANPCGVAVATTQLDAYERAYQTDPTSAFGGIIAFNQELDAATASTLINRQFVEVIIAPAVSAAAVEILSAKPNIRVLCCGHPEGKTIATLDYKRVSGGLLVQERDTAQLTLADFRVVTHRTPSHDEIADLVFAWKVVKFVKSNAIVYCRDLQTLGIGAGQMSRVYSARIAAIKAADQGLKIQGSVVASDAFFPFRDGVDAAAAAGVTAVIQPGGSVRDEEVIAAANEHGLAMLFTGMRHFRH